MTEMKLILLFCFSATLGLSQATLFDSIPMNSNFTLAGFTEEQKRLIENQYRAMQSSDQYLEDEDSFKELLRSIQLYAYELFDEGQKARYSRTWRTTTLNTLHSNYHHLQLTDPQKEEMIRKYEARPGSDTLKIIGFDHRIPKDIVLSVLDSTQLQQQALHETQARLNHERSIAEAEADKARDTLFDRQRLDLVRSYSQKHVLKAKQKLSKDIRRIHADDSRRLQEITDIYQARVEAARLRSSTSFYTLDSVLFAPVQLKLMHIRYDRYAWQPDLSVYWWYRNDDDAEVRAEGKKIITELEYFKQTYGAVLSKHLNQLKKSSIKLDARIEALRPPSAPMTRVNIVADPRTQAVEEVARLLLVRK